MRLFAILFAAALLATAIPLHAQASGEAAYSVNCSPCHGSDLSGQTTFGKKHSIPDLRSSAVQNKTDKELMDSIGKGIGHKEYPHGFLLRGMTVTQVQGIINYIRSMHKTGNSGAK